MSTAASVNQLNSSQRYFYSATYNTTMCRFFEQRERQQIHMSEHNRALPAGKSFAETGSEVATLCPFTKGERIGERTDREIGGGI